jgi:hypothetical protein
MKHSLSKYTILVGVLCIGVFLGVSTLNTYAGSEHGMSGWAWFGGASAANNGGYAGLGWISTNNLTDGSGVNYGVNVPTTDGPVTGYAWNAQVGWISFNAAHLSGCPGASGVSPARSGSRITGGARILSISSNLGNAGGYDGCISLDLTIAGTGAVSGYGWSGDLGWINFSGTTVGVPVVTPTLTVGVTANPTSGNAPLSSIITANLGGTATGNATYQFDCNNDGIYESTQTTSATSLAFTCTYSTPGTTFTPRVNVTREAVTSNGSATVTTDNNYNLTITRDGTAAAAGTIVLNPGTDCAGNCTRTYTVGTSVTLTGTITDGNVNFSGSGCSGNSCTLTMNTNHSVTATFSCDTAGGYVWNTTLNSCALPPGVCGSADGQVFATAPSTNLCAVGALIWDDNTGATDGTYNWRCDGTPEAICSAAREPEVVIAATPDLIRRSQRAEVEVTITATWPVSCFLYNAVSTATPTAIPHDGTNSPNTTQVTTRQLSATQIVTLVCNYPPPFGGLPPLMTEERIEVIPSLQEI